ncbi:Canalicular multispecific organic anion transporter 1, partial [Modicella reniformis]
MYKLQGSIRIRGRVAYVPQQAWIFNATLRDNILFGNAYTAERYRQVLSVCGLEPDLEILPAGDLTEIGERGINLSGGQKQRVSLARAAYDNAEVYLLDDPLSAVDAHVDRHLWDNLLGPQGMLKDKTRILVTHNIHHLEYVDQIVVIKEGMIAELGKYDDLMAAKQSFYQLIREYSTKHSRRRRHSHGTDAVAETTAATPGSDQASDQPLSEIIACEHSNGIRSEEGSDGSEVDSDVIIEEECDLSLKKAANKNHTADVDAMDEEEDELIAEEILKKGGIEWRLIKSYTKACTIEIAVAIVLLNAVAQMCTVGYSLWLKHWTSKTKDELQESLVLFLGILAGMTLVYIISYVFFFYLVMAVARIRASELIHRRLASIVMRLPMSFFDTTPLGRIINRFSSDLFSIDEHLPWKFIDLIYLSISVATTLVVIAATSPAFIAMIPAIAVMYYVIQQYFLWATRSLKRINSASLSPLYQHFDETLNGVSTIRAMSVQQRFIEENAKRTDNNVNACTAYMYCNRWVDLRLQVLSAGIILIIALSGVFSRFTIDPSLIGLSLNYALGLTDSIMWLCRDFSEWQSHLVAIERVQEYTDKNTEAPEITDKVVPEYWPNQGRVVFKDYSTRYREGLDLVIKHVSFEVQPGEKIGIVGRTGAGKSSLTLALFRIIEAANSHWARVGDNTG